MKYRDSDRKAKVNDLVAFTKDSEEWYSVVSVNGDLVKLIDGKEYETKDLYLMCRSSALDELAKSDKDSI